MEERTSYFDRYAAVNDLSDAGRKATHRHHNAILRPYLPEDKASPILDFGCGAGILLEWMKLLGYQNAFGIDNDAGQVKFAKGLGVNAERVDDGVEWLSSHVGFKLITIIDVIEHFPNPADDDLVRAMYHSLDQAGTLILRAPNANSSFASNFRYGDAQHHRSYTPERITTQLRGAGFRDVRVISDDSWLANSIAGHARLALRSIFRAFRRLQIVSELGSPELRSPLSLNLIAIARK